jgi:transposase
MRHCGICSHGSTSYAPKLDPSIAPEKLLRALLLQVLYSVRNERMLTEQFDYNLQFRWFVGLNMDDAGTPPWMEIWKRIFTFAAAAYNLVRLRNLEIQAE